MFFQTREITDILQARQIKVTNYSCIFPSRGMHFFQVRETAHRFLQAWQIKETKYSFIRPSRGIKEWIRRNLCYTADQKTLLIWDSFRLWESFRGHFLLLFKLNAFPCMMPCN
ncbi:uncharacterized protein [Acropora muricata]|uniref:uncharacterized protein isoform X5 n=1 Tax=Acropora muricata TaxID=159855 RepID=UPI0034E394F3